MSSVMRWRRLVVIGGSCVRWKAALHAEPLAAMTIIPGPAAPPEAEARDLDYRRGNKWFPKAFGLWRVQGGAVALLSWMDWRPTMVVYSVMSEYNLVGPRRRQVLPPLRISPMDQVEHRANGKRLPPLKPTSRQQRWIPSDIPRSRSRLGSRKLNAASTGGKV
jgi:hypothetical protein